MNESPYTRKNFLRIFGLTAGATLVSSTVLANLIDKDDVRKLTGQQQEFMMRYEKWMNAFIETIRIKKTDPDNAENKSKIIALANQAEKFKPEINEFLQDKTFSVVYKKAIERMSNEI